MFKLFIQKNFFFAIEISLFRDGKLDEQDSQIGRLSQNQRRFLQPYTLRWIHHYRFLHYNVNALLLRASYVLRYLYFLILISPCSMLRFFWEFSPYTFWNLLSSISLSPKSRNELMRSDFWNNFIHRLLLSY